MDNPWCSRCAKTVLWVWHCADGSTCCDVCVAKALHEADRVARAERLLKYLRERG